MEIVYTKPNQDSFVLLSGLNFGDTFVYKNSLYIICIPTGNLYVNIHPHVDLVAFAMVMEVTTNFVGLLPRSLKVFKCKSTIHTDMVLS